MIDKEKMLKEMLVDGDLWSAEFLAMDSAAKLEYGRQFIELINELIENGANLDPELLVEGEKVLEQFRKSAVNARIAEVNAKYSKLELERSADDLLIAYDKYDKSRGN